MEYLHETARDRGLAGSHFIRGWGIIIRAVPEAGVAMQFHVPKFTSNSGVMYIYRVFHIMDPQ